MGIDTRSMTRRVGAREARRHRRARGRTRCRRDLRRVRRERRAVRPARALTTQVAASAARSFATRELAGRSVRERRRGSQMTMSKRRPREANFSTVFVVSCSVIASRRAGIEPPTAQVARRRARVSLGGQIDGDDLARARPRGVHGERAPVYEEEVEHAAIDGRAGRDRGPAEPHVGGRRPDAQRRRDVDAELANAAAPASEPRSLSTTSSSSASSPRARCTAQARRRA